MKQLHSNYSISGSSITLTGLNIPLERLLLVADATSGKVLYSMAGPSPSSYTQATDSVITTSVAPSGNSDKLTIYYDDGVAPANAPSSVSVSNFPATQTVSGTVTANTGLSQPLTDTQLRASAIPVSGPLTDTQLRASAVPVSASSLPLPTGAATSANQTAANTSLSNIDADIGNVADSAASSDTGSFSLISLTKRLLGKFALLTDGTQKSQIVNGANTLSVDSVGAATTHVAPTTTLTYTATGAVSNGTVLSFSGTTTIDLAQVRSLSAHGVSLGTGAAISFQVSNDGTNWLAPNTGWSTSSQLGASIFSGMVNNYYTFGCRYGRFVYTNAQTAGTTTIVVNLSEIPTLHPQTNITGSITVYPGTGAVNWGPANFHTLISAASTNATLVKNSGGQVFTLVLTNTTASFRWFKLVNKSSAPTVGTDSPILNLAIPPNSSLDVSTNTYAMRLGSGIAYAITGGSALLDTTAVAAGDVIVNIVYA